MNHPVDRPSPASNQRLIPLEPKPLRRAGDRFQVLIRRGRIEQFRSCATGTLACVAPAAWWHHTGPFYRNAEPHRVFLTAVTLAELFRFPSPSGAQVKLACEDPLTFFRRLPPTARLLASLIFDAMHPTAQWAGHIYSTDYFHTGWMMEVEGMRRELRLLLVTDLYTRFVVAWATFVARPRSRDFREILCALAEEDLLPEIFRYDNEGCFLSRENLEWLKFHGVTSDPVAPGLPQFNGASERLNQTIEALIPVKAPSELREVCEDEIAYVLKYYHRVRHSSLGDTPAHLAAPFIGEPLHFPFPL